MRCIEKVLEGCPPVSRLPDGIADERSAESLWGEDMDGDVLGRSQRVLTSGVSVIWGMRRRGRS